MQTFIPYNNFTKSAEVLDNKRLWKNILETNQIYKILTNQIDGGQYKVHPVVKMWKNHEDLLLLYRNTFVTEWFNRRLSNPPKIDDNYLFLNVKKIPDWIDDERVYLSHKSNLIRKNPKHYRPIFGDDVPENLPYFWPI